MIAKVEEICEDWLINGDVDTLQKNTHLFTPQQWIYFIQNLKQKPNAKLAQLDAAFTFSDHPNLTIRDEWLINAVESHYTGSYRSVKRYVLEVSKPKIVKKFMSKLVLTPEGLNIAREIYKEAQVSFYARSLFIAESIITPYL
jgi:hypothetical protein